MIDFLVNFMNKALWCGFAFSIIGVLYYISKFILSMFKSPPVQMVITKIERIALAIMLSYIIMSIFTGIKL